VHHP
jgi:hypothetical protein